MEPLVPTPCKQCLLDMTGHCVHEHTLVVVAFTRPEQDQARQHPSMGGVRNITLLKGKCSNEHLEKI